MLYIKEDGQLVKLESWDDVLSRPNFVAKLDIKDKELKEVIGFYKNEQPVTCGIKSCRAIHRKGCIVRTADNGLC